MRTLRVLLTTLFCAGLVTTAGALPGDPPEAGAGTWAALGMNMAFTSEPLLQMPGAPLEGKDGLYLSVRSLTGAAVHLPLYAYDIRTGFAFSAIELASVGLLWASIYPMDNNWFIGGPATLLHSQIGGMYGNYEIYRREQAAARGLADPVGPGWEDMLRSQFSLQTLEQPWVWIPAALGFAVSALTVPAENAVWNTGEAWLGPWRTGALPGALLITATNLANYSMVGIGEEAFYRGVIYEELVRAVGPGWAKVLDAGLIFPLIHVPQYVASGNSLPSILMMCGLISTSGLVFDFAYDAGGLELSAAAHMWMDFFYYTAMALQVFGAPLGSNKSNNQTSLAEVRSGITVEVKATGRGAEIHFRY